MPESFDLHKVKNYFSEKLDQYGASPLGVDWNSVESQELRFSQVMKVVDPGQKYALLDFGSGYGACMITCCAWGMLSIMWGTILQKR